MQRRYALIVLALWLVPVTLADDDSHRAAAYRLIETTGMKSMIDMIRTQADGARPTLPQGADISPDKRALFEDFVDELAALSDEILEWQNLRYDFATIYINVFSEAEMDEMIAFYNTPLGRKMLERLPQLTVETQQLMHQRMATYQVEAQAVRAKYVRLGLIPE